MKWYLHILQWLIHRSFSIKCNSKMLFIHSFTHSLILEILDALKTIMLVKQVFNIRELTGRIKYKVSKPGDPLWHVPSEKCKEVFRSSDRRTTQWAVGSAGHFSRAQSGLGLGISETSVLMEESTSNKGCSRKPLRVTAQDFTDAAGHTQKLVTNGFPMRFS